MPWFIVNQLQRFSRAQLPAAVRNLRRQRSPRNVVALADNRWKLEAQPRTFRPQKLVKIKGPDNPTCQAFMYLRF